jgi:hypothetical protein
VPPKKGQKKSVPDGHRAREKAEFQANKAMDDLLFAGNVQQAYQPPPELHSNAKDIVSLGEMDRTIEKWMFSPRDFVIEALAAEPTDQQFEALDALGSLVAAKFSLLRFKSGVIKTDPRDQSGSLCKKIGISIMSGKGTGKDAFLAWVIIWFECMWPRAKMPVTGPSYDQIKDVLWKEVGKWLYRRDAAGEFVCPFHDILEIKADSIIRKGEALDAGDKIAAYARIRTAPLNADEQQQSQTLAGWHEENMIVVVDEASDVPDATFTQFDTTLTFDMNFVVMAFNPTRRTGFAYNTHFGDDRKRWITLQWDSRDSRLVTEEHIGRMKEKYGTDSPEFRMYVVGQPPEDDVRSLIPYTFCEAAVNRDLAKMADDPIIMGIDPARQGADSSVIIVRRGWTVRPDIIEVKGKTGTELAEIALEKIAELKCEEGLEVAAVYIDTIGYGASVFDALKRQWPRVYSVDVSRLPRNKKFGRLRDELWWALADRFRNGTISIPNNRKLISELSTMRLREPDPAGRTKVESKENLRRRGMPSPNIADALMITLQANDRALGVAQERRKTDMWGRDEALDDPYTGRSKKRGGPDSWMEM